mmetsp:Transcript_5929/g.10740  ORF Transcript_5929/g.10740 Transcript_5929/m.10740 type:complete len:335 (-) Transcript_5929:62-1066(-)
MRFLIVTSTLIASSKQVSTAAAHFHFFLFRLFFLGFFGSSTGTAAASTAAATAAASSKLGQHFLSRLHEFRQILAVQIGQQTIQTGGIGFQTDGRHGLGHVVFGGSGVASQYQHHVHGEFLHFTLLLLLLLWIGLLILYVLLVLRRLHHRLLWIILSMLSLLLLWLLLRHLLTLWLVVGRCIHERRSKGRYWRRSSGCCWSHHRSIVQKINHRRSLLLRYNVSALLCSLTAIFLPSRSVLTVSECPGTGSGTRNPSCYQTHRSQQGGAGNHPDAGSSSTSQTRRILLGIFLGRRRNDTRTTRTSTSNGSYRASCLQNISKTKQKGKGKKNIMQN